MHLQLVTRWPEDLRRPGRKQPAEHQRTVKLQETSDTEMTGALRPLHSQQRHEPAYLHLRLEDSELGNNRRGRAQIADWVSQKLALSQELAVQRRKRALATCIATKESCVRQSGVCMCCVTVISCFIPPKALRQLELMRFKARGFIIVSVIGQRSDSSKQGTSKLTSTWQAVRDGQQFCV